MVAGLLSVVPQFLESEHVLVRWIPEAGQEESGTDQEPHVQFSLQPAEAVGVAVAFGVVVAFGVWFAAGVGEDADTMSGGHFFIFSGRCANEETILSAFKENSAV